MDFIPENTEDTTAQVDEPVKIKKKYDLKTIQASVSQAEKDAFYNKCKQLNLSASEKAKELCMAWVNEG